MECLGCPRFNTRKKSKDGRGYKACRDCDWGKLSREESQKRLAFEEEKRQNRIKRRQLESEYEKEYRIKQRKLTAAKLKRGPQFLKPVISTGPIIPKISNPDPEFINERDNERYVEWRSSILKRDRRTCVLCGAKDWIQAHHIERWADNISKRYDLKNGVSLCMVCHQRHHGPHMLAFPKIITNNLISYIKSLYG